MIIILKPDVDAASHSCQAVLELLAGKTNVRTQLHHVIGAQQVLTEIFVVGDTSKLDMEEISALQDVDKVVRVSRDYRLLGRHNEDSREAGFFYNGVEFSQKSFNIFAGLCAVDNHEYVEQVMRAVAARGLRCTRMGAYKPRTNPYSFQGLGADCLPWVFALAGKYGIRVIAMEITHDSQIDEITNALEKTGKPTGVMLQIGTRNTQNFELLKAAGRQQEFPILLKRGFGITLEESLNAAEYLASEGNQRVVFCLRGMKSHLGLPHRNFVDFALVPTVQRLTLMPVCVDPSHSVGNRLPAPDGIPDLMHAAA
ncbi:MAG TPA: 3-deoxy-7-phosphoheptulonate synthase, partial [Gammaproteobacteria bacterium]|nr:3-deoxy-7-phosphoheptulonate synthase [Gammaproteobacteria bacterium]